MARIGLDKQDVRKARDSLVAQSQYPSVDAVRIALGNTGSKTTIHKYLKELDEEDGGQAPAQPATISAALQDLVDRLAKRLQHEADAHIATERVALAAREQQMAQAQRQLETELRSTREAAQAMTARLQDEIRQQRLALHARQDEVTRLGKENATLATELAHTKQALYEQLTHARKLEQRVEEMQAQQRHGAELERQLVAAMAQADRLGSQLQSAEAALGPALAQNRALELQLAQAIAKAEAQAHMGEQLRAYLDKLGPAASSAPPAAPNAG